jgi:DUF971 family protein
MTTQTDNRSRPTELRVRDSGTILLVTFDTGESFQLDAEFLRVESPSAEVKGHGPGQEVTLGGKRHVKITAMETVGNYAVRITFDDGHSTGLYSWDYLLQLSHDQGELWAAYLERLDEQGLTRG